MAYTFMPYVATNEDIARHEKTLRWKMKFLFGHEPENDGSLAPAGWQPGDPTPGLIEANRVYQGWMRAMWHVVGLIAALAIADAAGVF